MDGVIADLKAPFERWKVWLLMANQDVQLRYRRSIVGPFWISIAMATLVLGMSSIYSDVFDAVFKDYISYVGCGFVAWFLLAGMIQEGATSVIDSETHLRSLPLPIPLIVSRVVYRNFIAFGHNVLVIGLMLVLFGLRPTPVALLAIPALLLFAAFGLMTAVVLGPLCARFRDVPQVLNNFMQLMFFLTPLFWRPEQAPNRAALIEYNPFHHLVSLVRLPLLGKLPPLESWYVALGALAVMTALAVVSLAATRRRGYLWL
jgi:lipopolysaccharide transport system permease protein